MATTVIWTVVGNVEVDPVGLDGLLEGRSRAIVMYVHLERRSWCVRNCLSMLEAHHPLYESSPRILWSEFAAEDPTRPSMYVGPPDWNVILGQILDSPPANASEARAVYPSAGPLPSDPRSRVASSSKFRAKIRYAPLGSSQSRSCERGCSWGHLLDTRSES